MNQALGVALATAALLVLPLRESASQRTIPSKNPWFIDQVDPKTITWYRGCGRVKSKLFCDFIASAQVYGGTPGYPAPYTLFFSLPNEGLSYYDIWYWKTPNVPQCTGGDDSWWIPASCAPYMNRMTITGAVDWYGEWGEYNRRWIDFRSISTPEPASISLLATGLLAIGGGALRRRRRSRDAA